MSIPISMEGFLHHMAPQFLHPALQGFGCGAFRPIGGAFHPLYPGKAFARHLGEQYALGQSVGQALRGVREDSGTPPPPLYRHTYSLRDDTSSPGSAASASPRPCKDDDPAPAAGPTATATATATCSDSHDLFSPEGERKSCCGVCGTRLGPGVAQAHFLQELQHLYSLSALPSHQHHQHHQHHRHDEDARWETYQRIRANRQRRLKLRTRKRHHTVESMLGYDLDDDRRDEHPRDSRSYDAEDEPVDVEGDSLGWPEAAINIDDKDQRSEVDKIHLNYSEDLEISSTNDAMQSPERVSSVPRIETPKPLSLDTKTEVVERPSEVTTSEWSASDTWPALPEGYSHIRHKIDGEVPSSSDSRN
ncbi:protein Teyrha-meyrha-like [Leptidea sinapis]|uniref:protein Teyrha-meyrha-like n=1 Tax=Leptidea sinapis TaxID=189913 RepID=UPI00212F4EBF|nr:protein Teyrha-meyrha-like [Leptidea sinapis]XP_050683756.1 protein Teyrha-meyrha-like [Leptidea sinapis]